MKGERANRNGLQAASKPCSLLKIGKLQKRPRPRFPIPRPDFEQALAGTGANEVFVSSQIRFCFQYAQATLGRMALRLRDVQSSPHDLAFRFAPYFAPLFIAGYPGAISARRHFCPPKIRSRSDTRKRKQRQTASVGRRLSSACLCLRELVPHCGAGDAICFVRRNLRGEIVFKISGRAANRFF